MTIINATLISYFFYCIRRMWLHSHGIRMEDTSDFVSEGKLIGETTYPNRAARYKEIELSATLPGGGLGTAKIDFYDTAEKVVHEVKKSNSWEEAHQWQVRFYLYLLELNGIEGATGVLEYPKLRQTDKVFFTGPDKAYLIESIEKIQELLKSTDCPPKLVKSKCKNCSYFDFCWSGEMS